MGSIHILSILREIPNILFISSANPKKFMVENVFSSISSVKEDLNLLNLFMNLRLLDF
jgi:hypothetical protein